MLCNLGKWGERRITLWENQDYEGETGETPKGWMVSSWENTPRILMLADFRVIPWKTSLWHSMKGLVSHQISSDVNRTSVSPVLFWFHRGRNMPKPWQEYYVKEENPYTGEMSAKEIKAIGSQDPKGHDVMSFGQLDLYVFVFSILRRFRPVSANLSDLIRNSIQIHRCFLTWLWCWMMRVDHITSRQTAWHTHTKMWEWIKIQEKPLGTTDFAHF